MSTTRCRRQRTDASRGSGDARAGRARDRREGRRGGASSARRALPRVSLGPALAAPTEPSTDRARVPLRDHHGCLISSKPIDAGESLPAFLERSLTRPLSSAHQQHLRDVLRHQAAFVEKVEKAGKAAIAGLAASAVLPGALTLTTTRSYPIPISARSGSGRP